MTKELVLFGVTGDLAKQKLIPALFNLYKSGEISKKSSFIGFGRKKFSKSDFQNFIEEIITKQVESSGEKGVSTSLIRDYSSQWSYVESELNDLMGYRKLNSFLTEHAVIYLSIPPAYQLGVAQMLFSSNILSKTTQRKIAIEKPYGYDLLSSQKLESLLTRKLRQDQILRVDHYAGKQALVELEHVAKQGVFKNMLSTKYFKKILVHFVESKDVSMRGSFYDSVGALNDIFQNHMLHMLGTILALPELYMRQNIKSINTKKSIVVQEDLAALRATALSLLAIRSGIGNPVLAQYEGFRAVTGVNPNSTTETFFRVQGEIKKGNQLLSKRWGSLQIEFVGGKALVNSDSSITLIPKNRNEEPITILVNGYGIRDAYEQVFIDAFYYNKDRFISFDQIRIGWEIVEKIKKMSKGKNSKSILLYKRGVYPQDISYKS